MRLPIDVKRNLWSTRQSGLLAPRRMNFPIDNLALYLPLWHPELSAATIISKDLNATSCIVIGTTHTPNLGRGFNGTSDKIATLSESISANATRTLIQWIYTTSNAEQATLDMGLRMAMGLGANRLLRASCYSAPARTVANSTYTVSSGVWTCVVAIFSAGKVSFFANGVAKDADIACANEAYTGLWVVASGKVGDVGTFFAGTIGDVWIYSRVLTLAEILHTYEETKWRYS